MNNIKAYGTSENIFSKIQFGKIANYLLVIIFSLLVSYILIRRGGSVRAALGFATGVVVLLVTFYRVDWGFFIFISMVLAFDQFHIPQVDPITYRIQYFDNIKQITYLPHISALVMNPLEVQLFLMLLAWFIAISVRKQTKIQHIQLWGLAIILLISILAQLIHGLKTGGKFLPSLWEIRAIFYFGFLYFFVPQIIQTEDQIKILLWIFIIFISFKALQGAVRFVALGLSFGGRETLTNHEDPVFISLLFYFLLSLIIFDCKNKQRKALLFLFALLVLGFFAGQRRAAYAGFFISFIAFVILLNKKERLLLLKAFYPFFIFGIIYCAVFWNIDSKLGEPVELIKSGLTTNKKEDGERYLSNLYRKFERFDLSATFRTSPVIGIGFGKEYKRPIPLANISFPLRDYIPHDEILWVLVKTGAIGFFIFWFFFDSIIIYGTMLSKKLKDPYLRSVCIIIVIAIINQMVVSYFDLQLTYYRNMIMLGTLCGLLPALKSIDKKKSLIKNNENNES